MPEGGGAWDDEITVALGEMLVPVKTAAHAAMTLADQLAQIHREELDKTLKALEMRYGADLRPGDASPASSED